MPEVLEKALTVAEKKRPDVLRINEIFYSIQGEGSRSGDRCIFIRLTGCGLRCTYCDTEYAFYEGEDRSVKNVLDEIHAYDCKLVELTGGEPLEQEAAFGLMKSLCDEGYEVMVETGGHIDISRVDPRVKRIVDLKTPSSGMSARNLYKNIDYLQMTDEVKFVIGDRHDYLWSKEKITSFDLAAKVGTILMSPVTDILAPDDLAKWILEDRLPVRFQVQLHKIIWPGVERGV
ncbi:MAG: radical SAM protein [Bacteroidota bacterium]|nr:radical SAM protein [Bacteroidota bacterium]MDP4229900.1 radical SAM protein [Bacteroidota bacterium]MDP4237439.1 radical SAM protein [Bacteroidota bacterium]